MEQERYYRVWAEVDLSAIRHNIEKLQEGLCEGTRSCAVIKADGYGHGAVEVAHAIDDLVDFYAVATIDEAMELRCNGLEKPILILGFVHPSMAEIAIRNHIRLTVFDPDYARELSETAQRLEMPALIHIKVDTGMSRIGFRPEKKSAQIVKDICALPGIEAEGIFTHFANADDKSPEKTMEQLASFREFLKELEGLGVVCAIRHCSNSAASTWLREADLDMVRMGISIYGLYPSEYVTQIELEPALSLKSHVVMVKEVPEGTAVGYGSTWTAPRASRIATIPVGYADGYLRSLSNRASVLLHGQRFPVIGRVCMDQIMVDVTKDPSIREGDVVTLIGRDDGECISAEEVGELAGSFNYEFVCGLSRRVPCIYARDGRFAGVKDAFEVFYD